MNKDLALNTLGSSTINSLIEAASQMRLRSYAPYSHYTVGAAILTQSKSIITGCNIENAAYGSTICAERCAAFKAVSEGNSSFIAIAICGGPEGKPSDYAFPCGPCRQVLREFSDPKTMIVIVAKSAEDFKVYTLEELLPESFGPSHLGL